jgi:hypothetical protein
VCILLLAFWLFCLAWQPAAAQATSGPVISPPQFFLLPASPTILTLHTHTADFVLGYENGALVASVDAYYRLQNPTKDTATLTLKLASDADGAAHTVPQNLAVLLNGQSLPLTVGKDGALIDPLQIVGDGAVTLNLTYAFPLADAPLATLSYDAQPLGQWPGQPSLRVSLRLPATLPPESWLRTTPTGWRLVPTEAAMQRIRWLYDERIPDQPFVLSLIHPATWQQLQQATQAAVAGAPLLHFVELGHVYQQLSASATENEIRQRFYAQALAAYTAGVEEGVARNAPPAESASLHVALAGLYRTRALGAGGEVEPTYLALMSNEANLALAGLPAEEPQRTELYQWQVEGLTTQLNTARDERNWARAFVLLDQLAALPPEVVDAATLHETRRTITVQQALALLEQGDNQAAMTLAGDLITQAELLPPANARILFSAWQITLAIGIDETVVHIQALPVADRQQEAQAALEQQLQVWKSLDRAEEHQFDLIQSTPPVEGVTPMQLTIRLTAEAPGHPLSTLTPPGAPWALLRTLLAQVAPNVQRSARGLHQQVRMIQPLDLRSAGEAWRAMAATLEDQAAQWEAQSPRINLAALESARAESALQLRIRAANYRSTAHEWRQLARNSLVMVQMTAGAGVTSYSRTWLATPETPLQLLELEANVMSLGRLLVAALTGLAGLFIVSGLLWWML